MRLGGSIRRRRKAGKGIAGLPWALPKWLEGPLVRIGGWFSVLKDPWTLGGLTALALIGFGVGYLVSTRVVYPEPPPPGDLSTVPRLLGERPDQVADTLSALGLSLRPVDSLNHPSIPEGGIVGQSPLPGQLSLVGDTILVTLSTGAEQRAVPDVRALNADQARTILETSGFVVTVDSVRSGEPRGEVLRMTPEAGTEATIPMEVSLSVSLGPPQFQMPLLLGMAEEDAVAVLDSLGLVVGEVETRFRFGRDQGLVVEQSPPARTLVQEGSSVRLVVGRRGEYSGVDESRNNPLERP
jgi:beta-lactam-binding protein with PASTA domain